MRYSRAERLIQLALEMQAARGGLTIADIEEKALGVPIHASADGRIAEVTDNAIIPLNADTTQIFNPGDLRISSLSFDNSASGASNGTVSILVGYRPVASS